MNILDVDRCVKNSCKNEGKCENVKGGYKCNCPNTHEGKTCERGIQ